MAAWLYAVKKGANRDLQQAPLRQIGLAPMRRCASSSTRRRSPFLCTNK
jgi:hypothetical protein